MGKALKFVAALGVAAIGVATAVAYKKHKELEDYDYEELDDDFEDCCCEECCDCEDVVDAEPADVASEETAEEAAEEAAPVEEVVEIPNDDTDDE